jgi:hypothetical protein
VLVEIWLIIVVGQCIDVAISHTTRLEEFSINSINQRLSRQGGHIVVRVQEACGVCFVANQPFNPTQTATQPQHQLTSIAYLVAQEHFSEHALSLEP